MRFYGLDVTSFGAASVLAAYDSHPDGKLDLPEFARLVHDAEGGAVHAAPAMISVGAMRDAALPNRVRATFEAFDADRSGALDHRELRNALAFYGVDASTREAASVLAAYDDEPDGRMDVHEFAELVRDLEAGQLRAEPAYGTTHEAGGRTMRTASVHPRVRAAFEAFDADRSGALDHRELRNALAFYGVDASTREAASVLAAYDDEPDGRMDVHEFAELVRDAERGFVLGSSRQPSAAVSFRSRAPLGGLGSACNRAETGGGASSGASWPHHGAAQKRLEAVRDELARNVGVRDGMLGKGSFWRGKGGGEWVRQQLLSEQASRQDAEDETRIARAEAAAAVARVEALQAAAAARELEIEAAAARLIRQEARANAASGGGGGGRASSGGAVPSRVSSAAAAEGATMARLVGRLEVALIDKLDSRADSDSDRARAAVLQRVFRAAPVGGPRSDRYCTRAEFADGLRLLGLPQSVTPVQHAKPPTPGALGALPGGAEAVPNNKRQQRVIASDAAIDRQVVDAMFDKYAEAPAFNAARRGEAADKVLDYAAFYLKLAKAARRPGTGPSLAMAQAAYAERLQRTGGNPAVVDASRSKLAQERLAHAASRGLVHQPYGH